MFNQSTRPHKTQYTKHILIDSRDKDPMFEDSPFKYTIYFQEPSASFNRTGSAEHTTIKNMGISPFRNVTKVKLCAFSFPKILNEQYVVLDIPQFGDNLYSTNQNAHNSSCAVLFDQVDAGVVKTVYPHGADAYTWLLDSPTDISKIDINIKARSDNWYVKTGSGSGSSYEFTNNESFLPDHCFLLAITYEE